MLFTIYIIQKSITSINSDIKLIMDYAYSIDFGFIASYLISKHLTIPIFLLSDTKETQFSKCPLI